MFPMGLLFEVEVLRRPSYLHRPRHGYSLYSCRHRGAWRYPSWSRTTEKRQIFQFFGVSQKHDT